jgi:spore photoproduct lyase
MSAHFTHLYIEEAARDLADTHAVIARFPDAQRIIIDDYKQVFNRPRQDFQAQKRAMKLILACKKDQFIYDGSPYAPDFGAPNFYYNTLLLNCLYNCDYCYLQGMYPSANVVAFVNTQPFFEAAEAVLRDEGSLYLAISYDTDLLAFERILPHCRRWIDWAEARDKVSIELRTKSANFANLPQEAAPRNTILAWTLSPAAIAAKYEPRTPSLKARLKSMAAAAAAGWRIRICIDPVLPVADWQVQYSALIDAIFASVPAEAVQDVSLGVFRMNADYLSHLRKSRFDSDILFYPYTREGDASTCTPEVRKHMLSVLADKLATHIPPDRIDQHG